MKEVILRGHKGARGKAEGRAMVSKKAICWLKTVDLNGLVVEKENDLYGKNISGSILVFPTLKGSTSGSYKLYEMALVGSAPKAIINAKADSVTLSGAILSEIPLVHKFDVDPTEVIKTGDEIVVDGDTGTFTIMKQ